VGRSAVAVRFTPYFNPILQPKPVLFVLARYLNKQKGERRYYTEQLSAIPPAGLSKRHDREPPPNVPIGKYDTGAPTSNTNIELYTSNPFTS
jgi:hypothetical protein